MPFERKKIVFDVITDGKWVTSVERLAQFRPDPDHEMYRKWAPTGQKRGTWYVSFHGDRYPLKRKSNRSGYHIEVPSSKWFNWMKREATCSSTS